MPIVQPLQPPQTEQSEVSAFQRVLRLPFEINKSFAVAQCLLKFYAYSFLPRFEYMKPDLANQAFLMSKSP